MERKVVTKRQIERELVELRWRINKLEEEMKNDSGRAKQTPAAEGVLPDQNQSSRFFLGLKLSRVVKNRGRNHRKAERNRG